MEKERSYNKMMSPQQQIKYEFTNQDTVVFRIGGWGGGFLIICLSRASLANTPGAQAQECLVGYVIKNPPHQ